MAGKRGNAVGRLRRPVTTEAREARSAARPRQLGVAGERRRRVRQLEVTGEQQREEETSGSPSPLRSLFGAEAEAVALLILPSLETAVRPPPLSLSLPPPSPLRQAVSDKSSSGNAWRAWWAGRGGRHRGHWRRQAIVTSLPPIPVVPVPDCSSAASAPISSPSRCPRRRLYPTGPVTTCPPQSRRAPEGRKREERF
ncbi:Os09g0369250 [Oryza sativa Japonica Group]|uniref:Os09g0369250 protein n=1 Tax=Oryza sativa subsp. japonica TaxID=39947 RepID=A0A0P0XMA0_ORYSJ|nr:Os09g0369250 [Oryza sativa Japonica Group]